ncbi:hypothetical protein D9615_008760 [Tricholomella constricta]|uniref:AB hydrolase-1 domain-containing protein n=1 Tax=Tricholomella constricta TaxID=117010 RepID=A0A8H5M2G9_9AGAR|nr:hypothetical protein D9615_008760 [Tricholomella constricta]
MTNLSPLSGQDAETNNVGLSSTTTSPSIATSTQSFPEYVFIRASIAALRLIAPTSILYLAISAYNRFFLFTPILGALAIAEASFYLFVHVPRTRRLQLPPTYSPPALTKAERKALFAKCCTDLGIAHLIADAPYPRGWFLTRGAPDKKLRRQDVVDWLLWALFPSSPGGAQEEWREELDSYVATVEGLLGETLDDDVGESGVKIMRLTLDPVQTVHRPLAWYAIVCLVDTITSLNLLSLGFKHYSSTSKWFQTFPPRPVLSLVSNNANLSPDILLPYWYRPHTSPTKLPLVFLHGIGIGLHPYLPFIRDIIAQDPDIGILLIEFLPISMHMTTHPVPPAPLIASALNNILDTLNIPRIVVVAHSYGTFITSCVLRDSCTSHHATSPSLPDTTSPSFSDTPPPPRHPPPHDPHPLLPKLAHTLLIDPIPVLLHLPPVAHNFLYRAPGAAAEWQLWYFASTDADVARTLGRAFFWTEGVAWREDVRAWMRARVRVRVPQREGEGDGDEGGYGVEMIGRGRGRGRGRNVAVVLAGKDQIVPAESVRRYLTGMEEACARWVGRGWADWGLEEEQESRGRGRGRGGCDLDADLGAGALDAEAEAGVASAAGMSQQEGNGVGHEVGGGGGGGKGRGGGDLEVLFYPDLDHATVFDTRDRREAMLEVLGRYVRDS